MTTSYSPEWNAGVAPDQAMHVLVDEARHHQAACNAFLGRFAGGGFLDMDAVLRRFALEYSGQAAWSLRYLSALVERLPDPEHRSVLLRQIGEAHGDLDESTCAALQRAGIAPVSVQGVSQPELFRRLCCALDVEPWEHQSERHAARRWRARLLQFLQEAPVAEAFGALCFGIAAIAKPICDQLASGTLALGTLHRGDMVWFELPSLLGERDLDELLTIAAQLAGEPGGLVEMRRGMHVALELCAEFWDHMYRCAVAEPLAHPA